MNLRNEKQIFELKAIVDTKTEKILFYRDGEFPLYLEKGSFPVIIEFKSRLDETCEAEYIGASLATDYSTARALSLCNGDSWEQFVLDEDERELVQMLFSDWLSRCFYHDCDIVHLDCDVTEGVVAVNCYIDTLKTDGIVCLYACEIGYVFEGSRIEAVKFCNTGEIANNVVIHDASHCRFDVVSENTCIENNEGCLVEYMSSGQTADKENFV